MYCVVLVFQFLFTSLWSLLWGLQSVATAQSLLFFNLLFESFIHAYNVSDQTHPSPLSSKLSHTLLFFSKLRVLKFTESTGVLLLCVHSYRAIQWNMVILSGATFLKKTDSPSPVHSLKITSQVWERFCEHLSHNCWTFGWLDLVAFLNTQIQLLGVYVSVAL